MDQTRFDDLTRRLGAGATRRTGLKAALGALLGVGVGAAALPALEGEAKKKRKKRNCRAEGEGCRYSWECCDGTCDTDSRCHGYVD